MKRKFNASYDQEGDVLTVYRPKENVKESIEVTEDLIIDINNSKKDTKSFNESRIAKAEA